METSEILNSVKSELNGNICATMKSTTKEADALLESTKTPVSKDVEVNGQQTRKRAATPLAHDMPLAKCRLVDLAAQIYQLDEFCDEILCEIFQNIDTWSLLSLKCCNQRFADLVMDHRFWKNIDLAKASLPLGLLVYVLDRVHCKTHTLKLCGPPIAEQEDHHIDIFNRRFFNAVFNHGVNLTVLELEQIKLDVHVMRLALLPPTLKRLVISRCDLRDLEKNIFTGIEHYLINLKEFACEYNAWFKPSFIMALSKLPRLTKLSLRGCTQMSEFVPYGSLASRFGFKILEYLDLRQTPLTDSDLQCFSALRQIRVLLLDSPPKLDEKASETKKSQSSNERLAAFLTTAYEKDEEHISFVKVEETQLNGKQDPERQPEELDDVKSEKNKINKELQEEQPSCSNEQSSSANNAEENELGAERTVGILLENRREPIRLINRELRRDVQANGIPDFPEIDALQDLTPPPNNHIIVVRLGPASSAYNHFDRLMSHPIFWNMLHPGIPHPNGENVNNPAVAAAAPAAPANDAAVPAAENAQIPAVRPRELACQVRYSVANRPPRDPRRTFSRDLLSDRGICSFGRPHNQVDRQIVWIRLAQHPMDNTLEKLIVRNYSQVSDITLRHLVQCSPNLIYLDISGTSITLEGVRAFSAQKPLCNVVAHHLRGWPADAGISEPDPFTF